jgi:phosphoribosylanthranilate isomerase
MFRVKICGVTRLEDALMVAEAGAQAVGFVFTESPRRLALRKAKEIADFLPPSLIKVGVFRDEEIDEIKRIVDYVGLDAVQIHGEGNFPEEIGVKLIKAFEVKSDLTLDKVLRFKADAFLFDSGGGKGVAFKWEKVKNWQLPSPLILAGGLKPENVRRAIQEVKPFGVDVSSGVEKEVGVKDRNKLKEFISTAFKAFKEIENE